MPALTRRLAQRIFFATLLGGALPAFADNWPAALDASLARAGVPRSAAAVLCRTWTPRRRSSPSVSGIR